MRKGKQRKKWLTREKNYTIMKIKANIRSQTERRTYPEAVRQKEIDIEK